MIEIETNTIFEKDQRLSKVFNCAILKIKKKMIEISF